MFNWHLSFAEFYWNSQKFTVHRICVLIESCLKRPNAMKDFFQKDFERFISKIFSLSVARIEMVLKTCTSFAIISLFLRLIVLQTIILHSILVALRLGSILLLAYFSCLFSYNPLVLFNSRTLDTVFRSSVSLVLLYVGVSIRWSRAVCR